eukprot:SAG11_NODE_466_length_9212_cov_2.301986_1_plen_53_part_00
MHQQQSEIHFYAYMNRMKDAWPTGTILKLESVRLTSMKFRQLAEIPQVLLNF